MHLNLLKAWIESANAFELSTYTTNTADKKYFSNKLKYNQVWLLLI